MLQPATAPPIPSASAVGLCVIVNGARLEALVEGALWWPDRSVLIVSDMHFEKGSFFAARGVFLPPYDSAVTLSRLSMLVDKLRPQKIVALGDSFHDLGAGGRMARSDSERLQSLVSRHEWIWVEGNHDPEPPRFLGGTRTESLVIGPLLLRHRPHNGPTLGEIAGHLHPCAVVTSDYGRRVRAKCFATDGTRLVMPSFGAFTGNLNVRDRAFHAVFPHGCRALMMGKQRVYAVPSTRLAPETA